MQLEVQRAAARRIQRKGGQLFVWREDVGYAWTKDEMAFSQPQTVEFRRYADAGVEVLIAIDLRARLVRVEPKLWPWRGVKVYLDGERWGQRGRVSGETGVSYGGAGPP